MLDRLTGASVRFRFILVALAAWLIVAGVIRLGYPMAIVILGGLATSTLLNLFVLPALYLRWGRGEPAPRSI